MYISRQFELKHWRTTKNGGYKLTDDRDIYELEANMASRRIRAWHLADGSGRCYANCRCRLPQNGFFWTC